MSYRQNQNGRVFTLLNVWSEQNKGDFAIVKSTLQFLQNKYKITKNDTINIVFIGITQEAINTLIKEKQIIELAQYNLHASAVPFLTQKDGKLTGLPKYKKVLNLLLAHIKLLLRKGKIFDIIKQSDVLISVGGHYLFSFDPDNFVKEFLSLYALSYPLRVAQILGKKVNLLGVSIGPYYHKMSWLYLRKVLRGHKIFAREKFTCSLIKSQLKLNCTLMPDIAFYLHVDKAVYKPVKKTVKLGFTIRDWPFPEVEKDLRDKKKQQYKQAIIDLVKTLVFNKPAKYEDYEFDITFYPQVCIPSRLEDDRHIMKEVQDMLYKDIQAQKGVVQKGVMQKGVMQKGAVQPKAILDKYVHFWMHQPLLEELVKAYHSMHVMIGTRMHSLILGVPTPFVGIAYMGKKTHGLVELLEYPKQLIVDISNVDSNALLEKISYVLENHRVLYEHLYKKKLEFTKQIDKLELETN